MKPAALPFLVALSLALATLALAAPTTPAALSAPDATVAPATPAAAAAHADSVASATPAARAATESAASAGTAATASTADTPALTLRPCELQDAVGVNSVAAECGVLTVAENPAAPHQRRIGLRVARIPAVNRNKQPDALFVLAGGPGMAATLFYPSVAYAFARIHRDRDIVLLDQRGTGGSNPLDCALDDNELYRATDTEVVAEARRCLAALAARADVRFYTTSVAVNDLDAVRSSLGYPRIDLYGVSYGTRMAQQYVRRFGARARAVILDGVVPPQLALGPDVALNAQRSFERILARCARSVPCRTRFGDPAAAYHALHAALQLHAVPVTLSDPTNGQPSKLDFTGYHLATVLRLASYTAEQAALLPLLLNRATDAGDFIPLAAQFLLVSRSYGDVVAYGMHNSIVCSEDVPFYDPASIPRQRIEQTYLGMTQLDGLRNICSIWPRGPIDADFHSPLATDVPFLLLSGGDDPVTPPEDAEKARRFLSRSVHLVLPGFGHGQVTAPCIDRVMADFIQRGDIAGLDAGCIRADHPLPFFTSLGGPSP